ncbi:hypothetical protein THF1A12_10280 [Vibrio jasicida]|uniref:Uncharacterized protein n=1 Tax=Vibrio jasicida TaxID=766224 RepID=A0AAU9QDT5_9VIBR|nr:hypothetical protein THF1A12_10280 [Vibrio jasicida]
MKKGLHDAALLISDKKSAVKRSVAGPR